MEIKSLFFCSLFLEFVELPTDNARFLCTETRTNSHTVTAAGLSNYLLSQDPQLEPVKVSQLLSLRLLGDPPAPRSLLPLGTDVCLSIGFAHLLLPSRPRNGDLEVRQTEFSEANGLSPHLRAWAIH